MNLTLTHKFVGTIFISLVVCCAVVLLVSIYFMKKPMEEDLDANIRKLQHVIETANDMTATRFARSALLVANEESLSRAIRERNHEEVMRLSRRAMENTGSDFMTVTDDKGVVVGRGHSKKWQDSVLNQETVVKALKGEPAVGIVAGTVVPFTIRASQPVMHEGKVAGTLSIGASLVTPAYLDGLKQMSGMEATVFKGDTRFMTTIMKDGQRDVGSKIQSPEIADAVLKRGETLFTQNSINGVDYKSAYWPMRTADGKISGMWFVGMPLDNLQALEARAITNTIWATTALLLLQLLIAVFIGLRISAPVRKITSYVLAIAQGKNDAELNIHSKDDMGELADDLRDMVRKQTSLVQENTEKTKEAQKKAEEAMALEQEARAAHQQALEAKRTGMIDAARQIENVVNRLNQAIASIATQVEQSDEGMNQATSRLAETTTAMEEMNSSVLEVARNVSVAADMSAAARDKAAEGSSVVSQSVAGIQEVHAQSLGLKEDMAKLGEHARSIDTIMRVISDIADQTNLLALNAAIEAARAGDAGRGFAVVADEVRKLAEKTMASTTEVGNAIQAIQTSAENSSRQVENAVQHIAQANEFSNKSGEVLKHILQMVEQSADDIRAIATASEEQSAASEEITRSIGEVNDIAFSTSKAMSSVAQGLDSLRAHSQELVALIEEMKKS